MLYDKRWERKLPKVNSIEHFTAWLETKPANEVYNFGDYKQCAYAQYAIDNGRKPRFCPPLKLIPILAPETGPLESTYSTFGAALQRAYAKLRR